MTTSLVEQLISVIAPHECILCGREGVVLCAWCAPQAVDRLPARCYRCFVQSENSATCKKCRRASPLAYVWVCGAYDATAKELLHRYKFERLRAAYAPIAESMAECMPFMQRAVIVPVPTATSHIRQRGYDHSLLLAQRIAGLSGLRCEPVLARMGQQRQFGAKREVRKLQLAEAFRVKNRSIEGKEFILVDDILTTGSTLEAAALCLKRAGAARVSAVVFAQKVVS